MRIRTDHGHHRPRQSVLSLGVCGHFFNRLQVLIRNPLTRTRLSSFRRYRCRQAESTLCHQHDTDRGSTCFVRQNQRVGELLICVECQPFSHYMTIPATSPRIGTPPALRNQHRTNVVHLPCPAGRQTKQSLVVSQDSLQAFCAAIEKDWIGFCLNQLPATTCQTKRTHRRRHLSKP